MGQTYLLQDSSIFRILFLEMNFYVGLWVPVPHPTGSKLQELHTPPRLELGVHQEEVEDVEERVWALWNVAEEQHHQFPQRARDEMT